MFILSDNHKARIACARWLGTTPELTACMLGAPVGEVMAYWRSNDCLDRAAALEESWRSVKRAQDSAGPVYVSPGILKTFR